MKGQAPLSQLTAGAGGRGLGKSTFLPALAAAVEVGGPLGRLARREPRAKAPWRAPVGCFRQRARPVAGAFLPSAPLSSPKIEDWGQWPIDHRFNLITRNSELSSDAHETCSRYIPLVEGRIHAWRPIRAGDVAD